jgi:hypothetical protein
VITESDDDPFMFHILLLTSPITIDTHVSTLVPHLRPITTDKHVSILVLHLPKNTFEKLRKDLHDQIYASISWVPMVQK